MMTGRRQFLRECSLAMLAVSFAPATVTGRPWFRSLRTIPIGDLHHCTFASHLNTLFDVECGTGQPTLSLELVEASDREGRSRDMSGANLRGESFSLLFRGPANYLLPQGCHQFSHAEIGGFEMFITPVVSRDPGHVTYQAVFNRLLPPAAAPSTHDIV